MLEYIMDALPYVNDYVIEQIYDFMQQPQYALE